MILNVKQLRTTHGYNQVEFARFCGVDRRLLARVENAQAAGESVDFVHYRSASRICSGLLQLDGFHLPGGSRDSLALAIYMFYEGCGKDLKDETAF